MSRIQLLALLCGLCLATQPLLRGKFVAAMDTEDDMDDMEDELGEEDEEDEPTEPFDETDVVVITAKTFDDLIKQHKFALVEFYAPWCGHCKSLAPEYAKAATAFKDIDSSVLIGKVDATVETELAERFGVSGYPTLKWFVDGKDSEYGGGRDEAAIVQWLKKKTGPPATTVSSSDDIKTQESSNEVVVVGYFSKLEGTDYKTFISVAETVDDVAFVETTDKSAAAAAGLSKPGIAIIKNFKGEDREIVPVTGSGALALRDAINGNKLPLTLEFNQENSDKIFGSGIPRHILVLAKEAELEAGTPLMKEFRAVAAEFKGKFVFVTVNADSDEAEPVIQFFDLDKDTTAVVGFMMEPKQQKYMYKDAITAANMKKFAQGIIDGTVLPGYKSAEVKENDKDGDIQVVVGKSFDDIVKDPTKDVFLEVYAPWCGHCKQLAPTWKKLAKRFKDIDSVVIAKMDGTANEHPDIDIEGFPALTFFPAEKDAEGINYDGERTLKDMTKFIKEKAKVAYELKKKATATEDDEEVKEEL